MSNPRQRRHGSAGRRAMLTDDDRFAAMLAACETRLQLALREYDERDFPFRITIRIDPAADSMKAILAAIDAQIAAGSGVFR